jgi:hypothetical protein
MAELRFVRYADEEENQPVPGQVAEPTIKTDDREAPLSGMLRLKEGQDKISIKQALMYGAASSAVPFQFAGKAMGGDADPGSVPHEYLTKPAEEWSQGDAVWFAGQLGLSDTYRGVKQILDIEPEELKAQQSMINMLMEHPDWGGKVTAAYFGGMIADPTGYAVPIAGKGKNLYSGWKALKHYSKVGAGTGAVFAGAGYVDEEAPSLVGTMLDRPESSMTRAEQIALGGVAGGVLTPAIKAGMEKLGPMYNRMGDAMWKAVSTRADAAGGLTGAYAGFNFDPDAGPLDKMKNVLIGSAMGYAGGKGIMKAPPQFRDTLGRFFIPDFGLSDKYVSRRARMRGDKSVIQQEFNELVKRIANEPEPVRKALYELLTNDKVMRTADDAIDASVIALKGDVRDIVTKYGAELKDLGVLDPATFLRNKDTYLHRTYLRPDKDKFLTTDGKIRTIGDELKMRGKKVEVDAADWEKGLRPDDSGTWREIERKGSKIIINRDYTQQERATMNEVTDAAIALDRTGMLMGNDVATYRFLNDLSKDATIASAERTAQHTHRVPGATHTGTRGGARKFGDLGGKWVSKDVHNDIVRTLNLKEGGMRNSALGRAYLKFNSFWKGTRTGMNPAVHMNNVMSNVHLYDFYDGNWSNLSKAVSDLKVKGDDYKEALQNGVFGVDFVGHELDSNFNNILRSYGNLSGASGAVGWMERNLPKVVTKIARTTKKYTTDAMMKAYMAEDHIFRMGLYRTVRDKLVDSGMARGEAIAQAARQAREGFVDYSKSSPALEIMRNGPLPFISYMYGVVPRLAEVSMRKPHKLAKWALIWHGINAMGEDMSPESPEVIAETRRSMDVDTRRSIGGIPGMPSAAVKMPFADYYLNTSRIFPGGNLFETSPSTQGVGQAGVYGSKIPQFAQPSFGGAGAVAMPMMGVDQFTGKPIPEGERLGKVAQNFIPNLPVPPINAGDNRYLFPSYATKKIARAQQGRKQSTADQHTVGSSYASGFGVKLFKGEKGKNMLRHHMQLEGEKREVALARGRLVRELQKGDLTRKEYREEISELNERLKSIYEDFKEKMRFIKKGSPTLSEDVDKYKKYYRDYSNAGAKKVKEWTR